MKKLYNEHKGLAIVGTLAIVLFIVIIIVVIQLFTGGSNNKYGNRLEGINDVVIDKSTLTELKSSLEEKDEIDNATVRLQGKIVYIKLVLNKDITEEKAKEIASKTLDEFADEEIEFYDFNYFLKWENAVTKKDENEKEYTVDKIISGTKHPIKDSITWSRS